MVSFGINTEQLSHYCQFYYTILKPRPGPFDKKVIQYIERKSKGLILDKSFVTVKSCFELWRAFGRTILNRTFVRWKSQ